MRAAPDEHAEQVSQVIFGETVRLLRDEGEFTEIQSPDSYQGWVLSRHLVVLETGERYPNPARAAMVASLLLPVFREARPTSERRTLLTLGTAVELASGGDPNAEFYPIRFPNGEIGYLEARAIIIPRFPPPETLGLNLVTVARGMIGVPYLWGGRTPFGLDCSGFTQRVYWLCGHVIPRDAHQQAESPLFRPVAREELQPGDLVFFHNGHPPHDHPVSHVGIAMGNDLFIHSASGIGVGISSLHEPPYNRRYWGSRRLKIVGASAG
jgi:cell wall-associated NlpC family hydrolase